MTVEAPKPAWRRPPLLIALGALAVVAVVVAALMAEPEPADTRPQRELGPLALGKRIWTAGLTVQRNGGDVRLRDNLLLTEYSEGLMPVDARTGAAPWIQKYYENLYDAPVAFDRGAHQQLPFLVRHGDGVGVLVGYRVFSCEPVEPGLALLSGDNGAVVWRTPLAPASACESGVEPVQPVLWAADDTTALVSVGPPAADPGQVRTVAVDVATGQRRWEYRGVWPQAVAGDVALLEPRDPFTGSGSGSGTVTALDLVTGEEKWSLADRYDESHVRHVAGDVLVVETWDDLEPARTAVRVLDAATGRELTTLPDVAPNGPCVADATLVACQTDATRLRGTRRLVTFRVDDHAVLSVPFPDRRTLASVVDGRISVEVGGKKPSIVQVDRTGNVIDENPPGELLAVADGIALVKPIDAAEGETLAAYRVDG